MTSNEIEERERLIREVKALEKKVKKLHAILADIQEKIKKGEPIGEEDLYR